VRAPTEPEEVPPLVAGSACEGQTYVAGVHV
jgi:hypothetical protein